MPNTKEKISCLKDWLKQHNLPSQPKKSQDVHAPERREEPTSRQMNSLVHKFGN